MGTEHAFAYAYLGACRALLSMNSINLRNMVVMENFYCNYFRAGKSVSNITVFST